MLAAAFACAGDQKDTLRDFALRFAPRLGEMAHDVDPDCQAASIQALRALKDCGLLDELELGEDEDATLRDNVYAKIVDQAASASIRSDALAFALDLEEFDANTSQGDAQRSLRIWGASSKLRSWVMTGPRSSRPSRPTPSSRCPNEHLY